MTLLLTCLAAIAATIVWYLSDKARCLRVGTLALMYWGAALMWLVDAAAEYHELGAAYFTPSAADAANDAFLGACVIALGLVIWLGIVLVKDPQGTVHAALRRK